MFKTLNSLQKVIKINRIDEMHKNQTIKNRTKAKLHQTVTEVTKNETTHLRTKSFQTFKIIRDEDYQINENIDKPNVIKQSSSVKTKPKEQKENLQTENFIPMKYSSHQNNFKPNLQIAPGLKIVSVFYNGQISQLKQQYQQLCCVQIKDSVKNQIQIDTQRTSTCVKEQISILEQVLFAIATKQDYIQGMNYVVSQLLQISSEGWVVYGIFKILNDKLKIYRNGISTRYCNTLEQLIKIYLPTSYKLFQNLEIKVEFFFHQWLYTMFAFIVPKERKEVFITTFLSNGILSLFTFTLSLLKFIQPKLQHMDMSECLMELTSKQSLSFQNYDLVVSQMKNLEINLSIIKQL